MTRSVEQILKDENIEIKSRFIRTPKTTTTTSGDWTLTIFDFESKIGEAIFDSFGWILFLFIPLGLVIFCLIRFGMEWWTVVLAFLCAPIVGMTPKVAWISYARVKKAWITKRNRAAIGLQLSTETESQIVFTSNDENEIAAVRNEIERKLLKNTRIVGE